MLILNEKEIMEGISYGEIITGIEEAYAIYEEEKYVMPDRFHVNVQDKTLLYMPCILENVFGTKMLTSFPENSKKKLPVLDGLMILNDSETGEPKCMMDGKKLTALRTGAVGGVAIKYTTPQTVESVGLIGAGVQGFYQLLYACEVRQIRKIYIFDPYSKQLEHFVQNLRKEVSSEITIHLCESSEELVRESEVVITTTNSTSPTIPNQKELLQGKHFIGIGSYQPDMREYPDALYSLLDNVYIDADVAMEESGDLVQPLATGLLKREQLLRFSSFIYKIPEKERVAKIEKTTFFKSVGMAIFDVVVAEKIYQKAKKKSIGYRM